MTKRTERRLKWLLSVLVIGAAIAGAFVLIATKEEPPRADKPLEGTLVEVMRVQSERHEVDLHAKGTVLAAQRVAVQPEVGGRVVWQSPELVAGGRFDAGDPILRVDPRDYDLAVESIRSEVNRARLELRLETRRAEVAKQEWSSFGDMDATEDQRALAQREPQLDAARLALKAAESSLKKAELDRKRTVLRAPFNAMVTSENVDLGQLIGPQTTVATLVGTDEFHVQASVPVETLGTMRIRSEDRPGSSVRVIQRLGHGTIEREGELIRKLPDLDASGAMARVLLRIVDPLADSNGLDGAGLPLLLGSFVDVEVSASPLEEAIRLPRSALHNGRDVYVMNDDDKLEIREVEIGWAEPDSVLVTAGLETQDRVVMSRIPTPIPNMLLRTAVPGSPSNPEAPSGPAAAAIP